MRVEFKTEYLVYLYKTPVNEIKGKHAFGKDIIKQFKKKVEILIGITNIA